MAPPPAEAPSEPKLHEAPPSALTPVAEPRLQDLFAPGRLEGTMAVYDTADGVLRCGDLERCARGYIPASTFKIANTLIALENGVVSSEKALLRWDGQQHEVDEWNQDHTLRSAFHASCVPCYQQIAREIGESRMQDWLARLEYGNQDCSGSVDYFWLGGPLRITPLQQLDFLWRLDTGALPLRGTTTEVTLGIMEMEARPGAVLRGKTGWAPSRGASQEVAWFVGWLEFDKRRVYFATLIDGRAEDVDLLVERRRVTEAGLRALGSWLE